MTDPKHPTSPTPTSKSEAKRLAMQTGEPVEFRDMTFQPNGRATTSSTVLTAEMAEKILHALANPGHGIFTDNRPDMMALRCIASGEVVCAPPAGDAGLLRRAQELRDSIADTQLHGDGAHDDDCPVCQAIAKFDAALSAAPNAGASSPTSKTAPKSLSVEASVAEPLELLLDRLTFRAADSGSARVSWEDLRRIRAEYQAAIAAIVGAAMADKGAGS